MSEILLWGEFEPGSLGASWEAGLISNGHGVQRFDITLERRRLAWPLHNRYSRRLSRDRYVLRSFWCRRLNNALIDRASRDRPQLVIIHNGEYLFPETLDALTAMGCRTAIFHADNPLPPHHNHRPENLPAAKAADLYFVWSERLAGVLRSLGVNASFLPFAWDAAVFPQGRYTGEWEGAVFVGNWEPRREAILERLSSSIPLRIFGSNYWERRTKRGSAVRRLWQGRLLDGKEAAEEFRRSAISLNIMRDQHYIDGQADGLIMRHFEVPGAGGLLLSTRSTGATTLFPPESLATYFDDTRDCAATAITLLRDSARREQIARSASECVAQQHTYSERMRQFMNLVP